MSIETDAYHSALNRYPFIFNKKSKLIPRNNIVVGTEFLTPILDLSFSSLVDFFGRFTASMMEYGEPEISDRASIHVHISLPYPTLEILKNILILASHYETMFFYIGGMGYKFRGEKNDAIYCRPILKYGPPCVRGMEGYNQILNVNDLLKSDTILEFWYKYGDIASRDRRYHPVRYHWINLLPMYPNASSYKGTLEFRVFNKL